MLSNLIVEMAKAKLSKEVMAKALDCSKGTITNRLDGRSVFPIYDAMYVQKTWFPNYTLEYLFKNTAAEKEGEKA